MGDLKTTAEERARLREWRHGDASDARAWCVAEDACHDVDTLLAENAKLRAEVSAEEAAYRALDAALAALEAP